MSKRFEWHSYYKRMVLDTKINKIIKVIDTLNQQSERIAELEEQLENAIVPKFKIGQEVFIINKNYFFIKDYEVECHKIVGIEDKLDRKNKYVRWYTLLFKNAHTGYVARYKYLEKNVFATKEEALAKLKELQGEKK